MSTAGPRAFHFQRSNQRLLGMLPLTVQQACGRRAAHLHASASNQEIPAEGIPRRRGTPRGRSFPVQHVAAPPEVSGHGLDVAVHRGLGEGIRGDFPILHQDVNGKMLIYLDSGATSQKPEAVLRAMDEYNRGYNSNVHRGVHHLAAKATTAYEAAREKIARFIGASPREVVFTKNASEAVNLVAHAWGTHNLKAGDEVIVSVAEHHSNLVPWQLLCERTGASLRAVPLTPDTQEIDIGKLREMLGPRTKVVALVHVSNMLGAILDVGCVAEAVHKVGAKLLLDCCQAVPNLPINVHSLGADWIVASGHKMCGPTGIGFLWGRYDLLDSMKPFLGGGEMIEHVAIERSTYAPPPSRFEAGTPPIAEAIGLGAAVDYLSGFGMDSVRSYECDIGEYLYERLSAVKGVTIYGPPPSRGRAALCTFNVEGLHATDVSTLLDQAGIAIRSGHHCTQPLHTYLGISASARASPYIYNTPAEVDRFVEELQDTINFFADVG